MKILGKMPLRNNGILKHLKVTVDEPKQLQLEQLLWSNIGNQDSNGGNMGNTPRRTQKPSRKVYREIVFDVADKGAKRGNVLPLNPSATNVKNLDIG